MAQDFYKFEDSYYESGSNKKIDNTEALQEFARAGGKEIEFKLDPSFERIQNAEQIGEFDVKQQIGSTLFGTRKTTSVNNNDPIDSNLLERTLDGPDPTTLGEDKTSATLTDKVTEVAEGVFDGNKLAIDNLRAEQQRLNKIEQDRVTVDKEEAEAGIRRELNSDEASRALNEARELFDVEDNIKNLANIQQKIVSAQEALKMGLIFEENRPARMQLITGRTATLQKQGLASIGALQGTAAVMQGNIDLADAYAKSTLAAIKEDSDRNISALNTLLNMANKELIELSTEEKKIVEDRISALEDEINLGDADREAVIDLMKTSPKAFLEGGVTLLDTRESALRKMLPVMAADERRLFEDKLKATTTAIGDAQEQVYKSQVLQLKAAGATYDEAIIAYGDVLDLKYIREVYEKTDDQDPKDVITGSYYSQFLDESGNVKPGYTVTIDPKNGRPIVEETKDAGGGFWGWLTGGGKKDNVQSNFPTVPKLNLPGQN